VIRRDDGLRGRLTRVPIAWVAGVSADGVRLAVRRGEVSVDGSIIPIDEHHAAEVRRRSEGRNRAPPRSSPDRRDCAARAAVRLRVAIHVAFVWRRLLLI
jgi:hypothetical protein